MVIFACHWEHRWVINGIVVNTSKMSGFWLGYWLGGTWYLPFPWIPLWLRQGGKNKLKISACLESSLPGKKYAPLTLSNIFWKTYLKYLTYFLTRLKRWSTLAAKMFSSLWLYFEKLFWLTLNVGFFCIIHQRHLTH